MTKGEAYMPKVNISVEAIANAIKNMDSQDLEKLTLLLTDEGKKVLKRKNDIENKIVKSISRDEVFDV